MQSKSFGALTILLCIALSACAQRKGLSKKKDGATSSKTAFTYVSMRRTPCFGSCPVYTVEVQADGTVRYTGQRFTQRTGTYEKAVGAQKAAALFQQFARYRVDTCSDRYGVRTPDLPGIYFTLRTSDGREKTIANAHEGPLFLRRLATEVDSLGQVDDTWKKSAEPARE